MHTAWQLSSSDYRYDLAGVPGTREDVLPQWARSDRLGVIIREPFGSMGATMLVQTAITMFYDIVPARRKADPQYPEIYAIHVGGRFGDHRPMDFYPPRKESFLPDHGARVLERLNDLGISRLLIPERQPAAVPVEADYWGDVQSFRERTTSIFLYSPRHVVDQADITIEGLAPATIEANNVTALTQPARLAEYLRTPSRELYSRLPGPTLSRETDRWLAAIPGRIDEVAAAWRDVLLEQRILRRDSTASISESYRRLTQDEALRLL